MQPGWLGTQAKGRDDFHVMTNSGRRGGLVPGLIALVAALVFILRIGAQKPARFDA